MITLFLTVGMDPKSHQGICDSSTPLDKLTRERFSCLLGIVPQADRQRAAMTMEKVGGKGEKEEISD
jgi:hypothetical protein